MDTKQLLEHVRLFREKANTNKLIVFVGVGVSKNVEGMPNWYELIREMAQAIGYNRCSNCRHKAPGCETSCEFKEDYSQDEYLKIPQYVYNANPSLYQEIILKNISAAEIDAPLSKAIFTMNPAHIITTNYDKLIESCSDARRDNYDTIVRDKDLLVSKKNKYVIKMHGDIGSPETIILKESDYLQYSQKHVLIEMFVKALLSDHTILFLGYSLNDYNIKLIISWINYIRSQNNVLDKETKIGFIALDEEEIDSTEISYFENNNIGVINLRTMPLVEEVPSELTNDIGKRLYSFLTAITNASMERMLGITYLYDEAVTFLSQFEFVTCDCICENLFLGKRSVDGYNLALHRDAIYDSLIEYLKSNTENAKRLKKMLIKAGIKTILLISLDTGSLRSDEYKLEEAPFALLSDSFYRLYVNNQYDSLAKVCESSIEQEWQLPSFYYSFIYNYSNRIYERYDMVDYANLDIAKRCAYLFNVDSLDVQKTFAHKSKKLLHYINNTPDQKNRGALSMYTELYEGNTKRVLKMQESLAKLKEHYSENHTFIGCSSLDELYKIRRRALEEYLFYYSNGLFHIRFTDLKTVLKIYAEAILCTNGENETFGKSFWGKATTKKKYAIEIVDFDILTKFLSIKEIGQLFDEYKIKEINVSEPVKHHMVECFYNAAHAMIKLSLFNRNLQLSPVLINCAQYLLHIDLTPELQERIAEGINILLSNDGFIEYFYSTDFPEWRLSSKIMLQLMEKVSFRAREEVVWKILELPKLQEYLINSNMHMCQKTLCCIAGDNTEKEETQQKLRKYIESYPQKDKCRMIHLLRKLIKDETLKNDLVTYIGTQFDSLRSDEILDFAFNGWIAISDEQATKIMEEAIRLKKAEIPGMRSYPDPFENQIELICLLYITDVIKDISLLRTIACENEFLLFFFDDPTFDYSKIDFTHYMWGNIVNSAKFTEQFIQHKESVVPVIQRHIEIDVATELERKLLYGVLLDDVFQSSTK